MREALLRGAGLAAAALLGFAAGMGSPARAASPEESNLPSAPALATPPGPTAPPDPAPLDASSVIGGPSTCPRPDAVWSELVTLVPPERLEARLRTVTRGKTPLVEIVDLGVPYRILAAGQIREYRDESRDCAYRARIAAVFVALAIDPAQLAMPTPVPPAAPPPVPLPAPPPVDDLQSPRARLDLGATVVGGLGPEDHVGQLGAELRWSAGRHRFGPEAGVTALLPVDNTVGGVRLRQWRLPIDAGLRARIAGPRFEQYGELGISAALLSERALDLASSRSQTGLELGLRVAVGVHAARGRFAPFAALSGELVPAPPAIFALPAGTVGHTPLFWLGATAGASLGFF
ncbi:MAG TPA: hypothetical protein VLA79_10325 [Polyangia bacterium]|nr:hypothetical protein [Polyangia bacterium]